MYIQSQPDSLCLTERYDTSMVDVCLMAFILQSNSSIDTILKEVHKCLKPEGILVVFESRLTTNASEVADQGQKPLKEDNVFETSDDVKQHMESYGFTFKKQILADVLENEQWVMVFGK